MFVAQRKVSLFLTFRFVKQRFLGFNTIYSSYKVLLATAVCRLAENTCRATLTVVDLLNPTAAIRYYQRGMVSGSKTGRNYGFDGSIGESLKTFQYC